MVFNTSKALYSQLTLHLSFMQKAVDENMFFIVIDLLKIFDHEGFI
jgi:hypothetical protein